MDEFTELSRQARQFMLEAANQLAFAIDAAEEGTYVVPHWNAMEALRQMADQIDPPVNEWPQGGAVIYDFNTRQKVNS
jgi:hypothetical protein